ncbi:MAG TPA: type II CAAX endopeptidase family protein [Terriglobia bacterium]|jgi:membrane protease YdiL (CAAX protease family)
MRTDAVSELKPAPQPRRGQILAWLIILVMVALLIAANAVRAGTSSNEGAVTDLRMKIMAQEAIASRSLSADQGLRVMKEMESEARSPEDKVRVAILSGYLQGKAAALSKLDISPGAQSAPEVTRDLAALHTIYMDGTRALRPGEAGRLIRRYEYFGRMALASDRRQVDEARKSIDRAARRTFFLLGVLAAGMLGLVGVSLGLSVTAIVCWRKGKIRPGYVSQPDGSAAYLKGFALYLVLFVLLGLAIRWVGLSSPSWNWVAWLIIPAVILIIVRTAGPAEDWRTALGWYSGRGWWWEFASGIAGYLACLPIVGAGILVTVILIRITGTVPRDAITPLLQGNILVLYGIACVWAPVLEETMFRGALFHHLRGRWGWAFSAAVVSCLFAVIHPQGWAAIPALGSIAMSLAALREWRGSIIAPMAAHAFNNFLVITLALALLRGSGS